MVRRDARVPVPSRYDPHGASSSPHTLAEHAGCLLDVCTPDTLTPTPDSLERGQRRIGARASTPAVVVLPPAIQPLPRATESRGACRSTSSGCVEQVTTTHAQERASSSASRSQGRSRGTTRPPHALQTRAGYQVIVGALVRLRYAHEHGGSPGMLRFAPTAAPPRPAKTTKVLPHRSAARVPHNKRGRTIALSRPFEIPSLPHHPGMHFNVGCAPRPRPLLASVAHIPTRSMYPPSPAALLIAPWPVLITSTSPMRRTGPAYAQPVPSTTCL